MIKWENNNKGDRRRHPEDIDWFGSVDGYRRLYRVANRWTTSEDCDTYYAIYYGSDKGGADVIVQVSSPKAGIRWCQMHHMVGA